VRNTVIAVIAEIARIAGIAVIAEIARIAGIAKLQELQRLWNRKLAESQNCRITNSQSRRIAESQNRRILQQVRPELPLCRTTMQQRNGHDVQLEGSSPEVAHECEIVGEAQWRICI
jgi:hypothetical protein